MKKKRGPAKRKPVNRGAASEVPEELAEMPGKLAIWRPPRTPEGLSVLCLCLDVKFRYGRWDLLMLPVTGGGVAWAESPYVAPASVELNPAQLLADFEERVQLHYSHKDARHAQDHDAAQDRHQPVEALQGASGGF